MGRSKLSITTQLMAPQLRDMNALAKRDRRSRSGLIRDAVDAYLAQRRHDIPVGGEPGQIPMDYEVKDMSAGNWMQDAVRTFHRAMGSPAPNKIDPDAVRLDLRARLILEEAIETVEALGFKPTIDTRTGQRVLVPVNAPNWPEVLDGLCDLLYVTFGTAVELGIGLGPFFAEVHRSNMTKVGGLVREDGKILKPDHFERPRLMNLWQRALNRGKAIGMPSGGYS